MDPKYSHFKTILHMSSGQYYLVSSKDMGFNIAQNVFPSRKLMSTLDGALLSTILTVSHVVYTEPPTP